MRIKNFIRNIETAREASKAINRKYDQIIDQESWDRSGQESINLDNFLESLELIIAERKVEKKFVMKYIFTGKIDK